MATLDYQKFRAQFSEFSDQAKFPDAFLQVFYDMAGVFIEQDGCYWRVLSGDRMTLAMNYMTAHLLELARQQKIASASGAPVGQAGFTTSASIGEISVAKLAPPAKGAWDWWLYQTPYGTALMALLSTLAVGGFSVGGHDERSSFRRAGGVFF